MRQTKQLQSDSTRPQVLACLLAVIVGGTLLVSTSAPVLPRPKLQAFIEPARNTPSLPQIIKPRVLGLQTTQSSSQAKKHKVTKRVSAGTVAAASAVDCGQVACLALTFDDGPNPLTTPQVVDELRAAGVQATFFMIGSRVPGNEALLRQMWLDGDEIENHSWTHPDFRYLTVDQIHQEIDLTQQAIMAAGVPAPTMFRPPYGGVDANVEANVPLSILLWNEDPRDWDAQTSAQIVQSVEAAAQPGGIVDMHDIYHITADALPQIITDLQSKGYHLVTVSQLLQLTPQSHGLFYSRNSLTTSPQL